MKMDLPKKIKKDMEMETLQLSTSSPHSNSEISDPSVAKIPQNFPNELTIEILTRLPAKSLIRFRCVSKSWRALVSTPKFIKAHLEKSSKKDNYAHHRVLFLCKTFGDMRFNNYHTKHFPLGPALFEPTTTIIESTHVYDPFMNCSRGMIVGSCNGLICVTIRNDLFFWNPAISKFKKLVEFDARSKQWNVRQFFFDYDEPNDEYKLYVVACEDSGSGVTRWIDVYSGKTDSWRRIEGFSGYFWPVGGFSFVGGKLHWSTCPDKGGEIACFDLESEAYGVVENPKYGKGSFDLDLQVLGGCLAVCCYFRNSHVDLWIMKEYGVKESWTKVLLVPNIKDPRHKEFCVPVSMSKDEFCVPVFMSKDGKIVFRYLKRTALYDPKHSSVTYPRVKFMGEPFQMNVYVESLVLLDDHDAMGPKRESTSSDLT